MDGIDKTVYVEGQEESRVKTVYVNIGNLEYVPLADWFYEKYKVPEEDRKAPAIFIKMGTSRALKTSGMACQRSWRVDRPEAGRT